MMYERSKEVIKLETFKKSDYKQLINWINSEEFLIQWSGNAFTFPLDEQQLEKFPKALSLPKMHWPLQLPIAYCSLPVLFLSTVFVFSFHQLR